MHFFKVKLSYFSFIGVFLVIVLLGLAQLGSLVNPVPKNMPVILVQQDSGVQAPDGSTINYGKLLGEKLTAGNPSAEAVSPVAWTSQENQQEALDAMNREKAYAAVVIPADFSQKLASIMSSQPEAAPITLYVNQGMNLTGANMTSQALTQMLTAVNNQVREQLLAPFQQKGISLTVEQTKMLANPVTIVQEPINPVGARSANGNAPAVLSQLVWFSSLVASIMLFFSSRKATQYGSRAHRLGIRLSQVLFGAVATGIAALSILWIAGKWFGLSIPDYSSIGLFLFLTGFVFFLIQTTFFSWLGMAGSPLLLLVFFFGAPILTLPPQLLPKASHDWLYSWIPLRFSSEGLRDLFYFRQGLNLSSPAWTLAIIGMVGFVLIVLSVFKKHKATAPAKEKATANPSASA